MNIFSWFPFTFKSKKRLKEDFDKAIARTIDRTLEEVKEWTPVAEGDMLFSNHRNMQQGLLEGDSIFDKYDSVNVVEGEKVKKSDVAEASWTLAGLNPFQDPKNIQTEEKLRLQQKASVSQWATYPIAKAIIDNTKRYVLGTGVKIDCPVPEINDLLKTFWLANRMEKNLKHDFREYLLNGEIFPILYDSKVDDLDVLVDPILVYSTIPSEEINSVEYDRNDRKTRLSYKRRIADKRGKITEEYYLDISHPFGDEAELKLPETFNRTKSANLSEAKSGLRMAMFKNGRDVDYRGRVLMEAVLRWNRVYLDFAYDRARLNHLRSKIYLIETRGAKSGKITSSSSSAEKMPKGGIKLIETPDKKFRVISPNTGAGDAYTDIKVFLYLIGSAFSMPIHILNVNAENENYASIREAGNPFAQFIQDLQDDLKDFLLELLRYVIATGIRKKHIQDSYEVEYYPGDAIGEAKEFVQKNLGRISHEKLVEQVGNIVGKKEKRVVKSVYAPINITFPNVAQAEPVKQAEYIKILLETGLISRHTAQLKVGLDPDIEIARMQAEYDRELEKQEDEFHKFNVGKVGKEEEPEEKEPEEEK